MYARNRVVALVAVIVFVSGSFGVWFVLQENQRNTLLRAEDTVVHGGSSGSTLPSDGTTGIVIRGNDIPQTTTSTHQSQQPSTSAPTQAESQGEKATLNPTEFSRYNTYKAAQNAVFAEIVTGTGAEATAGKKLSVNYRGWLTNGSIFDQNSDATKPFVFTLGEGKVIPGWEQGIAGMKVGGERLIIVPPAAGYGNVPQGPIPADSVLVFYVKLLQTE